MAGLLSYSGITAKVKAMEGSLIQPHEYMELANMDTVSDFVLYLKNHIGYSSLFKEIEEQKLHRGQIEAIIANGAYNDFAKIYLFAGENQRKFLSLHFFRIEVTVLKSCLQCLFHKDKIFNLDHFSDFFNQHSQFNVDLLLLSSSLDEFIQNLKNTEYAPLFETLNEIKVTSLFEYETQLDVYYFKKIWRLKNHILKGKEQLIFTECIGRQIDLQNIMWIYRSKKFYTMDSARILAIIIPISYKLKKTVLQQLIYAETTESFFHILSDTCYAVSPNLLQNFNPEQILRQKLIRTYQKIRRNNASSMAPIQYYLYLKELEIDMLTTILEGIRYNLDPDTILNYLR